MTIFKAENTDMDNATYYILTLFKQGERWGEFYKFVFFSKINAKRRMRVLSKTGLYSRIVLRQENVFHRRVDTEISTSEPIERWEAA